MHRLNAHDVTVFRDAVREERTRCAAAAARLRKGGREDLAAMFDLRGKELVQLARALDAGAELAMPRIAGRSSADVCTPRSGGNLPVLQVVPAAERTDP